MVVPGEKGKDQRRRKKRRRRRALGRSGEEGRKEEGSPLLAAPPPRPLSHDSPLSLPLREYLPSPPFAHLAFASGIAREKTQSTLTRNRDCLGNPCTREKSFGNS